MRLTRDETGRLLSRGRRLLRRGRSQEAALVFGRILLRDPGHAEAREGKLDAEAADAEQERLSLARLEEARLALERGDAARARKLVREALRMGGDRDRALDLLDRLDGRQGRVRPARATDAVAAAAPETDADPRDGWPRDVLVALWALGFALLASTVASSWERLVNGLASAPLPRSSPASPVFAAPSAGEAALAEARRLMEKGDGAGALAALDGVNPQDPVYPFALRFRSQAERTLREGGPRR